MRGARDPPKPQNNHDNDNDNDDNNDNNDNDTTNNTANNSNNIAINDNIDIDIGLNDKTLTRWICGTPAAPPCRRPHFVSRRGRRGVQPDFQSEHRERNNNKTKPNNI